MRTTKVKKLFSLCFYQYRGKIIISMILTIFVAFLIAINPIVIAQLINELVANVTDIRAGVPGAEINLGFAKMIIIFLFFRSLASQVSEYTANYILTGAVQGGIQDLRTKVNYKMNHLPVCYFDKRKQGTVLSVITNDVDAVSNAMQQSLLVIVNSVFTIIMEFVMMSIISWRLTLICLIIIPGTFIISKFIVRRSQRHFRALQDNLADLNGYIQERYTGHNVLKLYNMQSTSVEEFQYINNQLNEEGFRSNFTSGLMGPLLELLINLLYCVMVFLTGGLVLASQMEIGSMQAFVQYIWQMYSPLGQVTQLSGAIQTALASVDRIVDFLEEPEEPSEENIPSVDLSTFKGDVRFEHVGFSYKKGSPLIKDVSFEAKPGQMIAIVGPTGAGKTTLINLLMRFYEVGQGHIYIDGKNTRDMKRNDVRALFGMVLQDAWLYHATIADNIRFGRLGASDYDVVEAAKSANVDHFIRTMPGGYDMMINEEANNVSLGQKQLLTIARVFLANPKILILDEATSSVDTRLELLIQKAMRNIMENRTSFVIAHRLSTIRDADLILVLDHGDIIEQGTHEELLAQSGFYYKLYNSQFAED